MPDKHLFAFVAMACTTVNGTMYVRAILQRKIQPHIFSWFLWGLIMAIGCVAQFAGNAGIGAWPTGYAAIMCFTVAALSLNRGERTITRSDWAAFIGALAAIPMWIVVKNPLGAVVLISLIDALGFYPTFRKSYVDPWQEKLSTFVVGGFVAIMTTLALETYSLDTMLYPVSLIVTHFALVAMLLWRRAVIKPITK